MDVKDRKILFELDKNSRASATQIAKKTNLSKDVVNYRIKRLKQRDVINKYLTVFDTAKLGYTTYKFFLKLQNTSPRREKEIITSLVNHPNTQFVVATQGAYDVILNILASSPTELSNILEDIHHVFGKDIAEQEMMIMVKTDFFYRDYLIQNTSHEIRKSISFGSTPQSVNLDKKNTSIISLLARNARMPVIEIAQRCGISSDTVIQRIKKLEKAQIISHYVMFPNAELAGFHFFKLLFRLSSHTSAQERRFFEYCKQHPNIWWVSKSIGLADMEINIDVESQEKLKLILNDIKGKFHTIIKDTTTIQVTKTYKFNLYPMGKT